MNPRLFSLLMRRFRAPEPGEEGGGGKADRGDDFTPTDDDADEEARAAAAAKGKSDDEGADKGKKAGADDEGDKGKDKKAGAEGDDDETDEEKEEREAEEARAAAAAKDGKKDTRIPLSRHKDILERERTQRAALERELEGFRKGAAVATTNEDITKLEDSILKMEKEYTKLLADGELDKAAEKMAAIRRADRTISETKSQLQSEVAEARAYERVRYDTVVDRLEVAYPQLLKDHADYDADKVNEILELKEAYQLKGYTAADAVQKATRLVFGAATVKQDKATTTDVKVDKEDLAKATAEERKKAAVDRNLKVSGKQPADLTKVGLDNDKMGGSLTARDAVKLSHEEFSKLDETTLAKMRGDVVA